MKSPIFIVPAAVPQTATAVAILAAQAGNRSPTLDPRFVPNAGQINTLPLSPGAMRCHNSSFRIIHVSRTIRSDTTPLYDRDGKPICRRAKLLVGV
jgi:hypothetical protein